MRLSSVDTHLVVALHALLQEKSVTRAARRVGVTQPSMSHALGRLRRQLDDPLLVSVGREMRLTERARRLVEPVREAVERLERVFAPKERFDPSRARRVFRLATTDNLALLVLPSIARRLSTAAPHVDVRCVNIGADWPERLLAGDLDAKLGRADPPPKGCRATLLARETYVCLMRRDHPLAKKRLTLERFVACPHLLVSPHGDGVGVVDRALARRALRRRVALTVPQFLVAPFIVARSDLLLTVSARVADALARPLGLTVRPCPVPLPSYGLAMIWPALAEEDEGHTWLRAEIAKAVADG